MNKLFLAVLLSLSMSLDAGAEAFETQKPVVCDKTKILVTALDEKYGEKPTWYGKDAGNDSRYVLFVNPKTKSWTMIQMSSELSCIIGVGEGSSIMLGITT